MNNKGNGLILSFVILHLIVLISVNLSLNISHLKQINQMDTSLEITKIKVINRVKREFYEQTCEDFIFEDEFYRVEAIYEENKCTLRFIGENEFEMILTYDDVFLCIGSIEYNYSEWSY